jgi:hypothetical protein
MNILRIVTGDTPQIVFSVRDDTLKSRPPVDLSDALTSATLKIRKVGTTFPVTVVACTKLTGVLLPDGDIDDDTPYDVEGAGGRCMASIGAGVFPTAGDYQAQLEVMFGAVARTVTVWEQVRIQARDDY